MPVYAPKKLDQREVLWENVRATVRLEVGQGAFDVWIEPLRLVEITDDIVELCAPSRLIRDYVYSHHLNRLEKAFRLAGNEFGIAINHVNLSIALQPTAMRVKEVLPESAAQKQPVLMAQKSAALDGLWDRQTDPAKTFAHFVVGESNLFAFKAAEQFARGEGEAKILFLSGAFGYGKTHLLNAIAFEFNSLAKGKVLFLRAEDFMRRFLSALRNQQTLAFKEEIRAADLLLFDDLQHICGRTATISEFLFSVNALTDLGKKVVVAADHAPYAIGPMTDELRSQLSGGLCVEIKSTDAELRFRLLKQHAHYLERKLPRVRMADDILSYVAQEGPAPPREVLGVLMKLATYADLTGKPVTREIAEEAVGTRALAGDRRVTIDDIQKKTCEYYKIDVREIHSARRARRIARPRQVAMYFSRELTERSLPDIGRRFGGRDHTTVLHACRRIEELCASDPIFKQEVEFLRKTLARA